MGDAAIPAVARAIELQWSDDALADLGRFAAFLQDQSSELAAVVADAIVARTQLLARHPKLGRPIAGREEYRQVVLEVLGGAYIFQYRHDGDRLVILRVFMPAKPADHVPATIMIEEDANLWIRSDARY